MVRGFVVLPDTPAADRAVGVSGDGGDVVARHPSGRALLVVVGPAEPVVRARAGRVVLVAVGFCPVTPDQLAAHAARVRSVADLDRVALPGSSHLVASVDGRVRVQGSLSGVRRVAHARVGGVPVASDRAALLARLAGTGIDEDALAVRVVCGDAVPPPLGERSTWRGVTTVPPDHCLLLGDRVVRRWTAPEPALPAAEGVAAVRDALVEAMGHRRGVRFSADLSGGLDSGSLCFLAAHHGVPDLLTVRVAGSDPHNDDAVHAARAVRSLPHAEHLVLSPADLPALFTDPARATDTDEPTTCTRTDALERHVVGLLADRGYHHHVGGHGGDELFLPVHGHLHGLLRRAPVTALRLLRAHRAVERWPPAETLRGLLARPGTVSGWWRDQAAGLTRPGAPQRGPLFGWGLSPLRASSCATPEAVATARAALRRAADDAEPLAADPGQHQTVLVLRTAAAGYRHLAALHAEQHVFLDLPYLDDRVLDAVLSVQAHHRSTPWQYKRLLAEAMRGILPEPLRRRQTKGDFSAEAYDGLRRNAAAVRDLFADSLLAERGLVDPDRVRRLTETAHVVEDHQFAVEDLIGCEAWLRAGSVVGPAR
ncbi:asparagine synthase-related protein [Actinosynnema sp. NPDC050436]|uniref:asparagine synthase-related protein n=1 Tax=Actinosynnema sp. NPDC050436 TaxID=3155659 RepID=UPI003409E581